MRLSVIIPFHKEIQLIDRAVKSVLINAAAVESVEIIICNDGEYCENEIRAQICSDGNQVVRILKNKNKKGAGGARNTGLDAVTGDIVAFLDADDCWLIGKIEAQLSAIRQGATFVATSYSFEGGGRVILPPPVVEVPIDVFLRRGIGTSTVMLTKGIILNARFRDIKFAQDIDYWYALAANPLFIYKGVKESFVNYRRGGETKNKFIQLSFFYKVLRLNKISIGWQILILFNYILSGLLNHYFYKRIRFFGVF